MLLAKSNQLKSSQPSSSERVDSISLSELLLLPVSQCYTHNSQLSIQSQDDELCTVSERCHLNIRCFPRRKTKTFVIISEEFFGLIRAPKDNTHAAHPSNMRSCRSACCRTISNLTNFWFLRRRRCCRSTSILDHPLLISQAAHHSVEIPKSTHHRRPSNCWHTSDDICEQER